MKFGLRFSIDRPWRARVGVMAVAAGMVLLLQLLAAPWLNAAQEAVGDWGWRLNARADLERRVVVVDIDEASLNQVGPWPWPRTKLAQLSQRLQTAGVAVQVFDMVFPEAREGDEALAQAWAQSPVVVGQIFSLDPLTRPQQGVVSGDDALGACSGGSEPQAQGWVANASGLLVPGLAVGHLTPRVQGDGVIRRVPAWVCHQGQRYPSLALAALSRLMAPAAGSARVTWQLHQPAPGLGLLGSAQARAWLQSAQLPGVHIPVDARGDMLVPYRLAREGVVSVSAADVLSGRADPTVLRGAVALVGATAFGLTDTVSTPLSSVASGVEVHLQSLLGILDRRVPFAPQGAGGWVIGALFLTGLALLSLVGRKALSARTLPITGFGLALVWVGVGVAALCVGGWVWPWQVPALYAVVGAAALAAVEHSLAKGQRERLSAHLSAYLPEPVAAQLVRLEPTGQLDAQRREITVLVGHLRNFDAFAIHSAPEEVAATLHAYTCLAVEAVEAQGGVIEQVAGDRVVAVWNAYAEDPDHAQRALAAARAWLHSTRGLLAPKAWKPEASELQPLALGVGMESGHAIVGSFGPAKRRAHAALGEPVSVAARLQGMTQDLSLPLLIGPRMAAALPAQALETQGEYLIEGQRRAMEVFAPVDWAQWLPPESMWPAGGGDRGEDPLEELLPPGSLGPAWEGRSLPS